MAKTKVNAAIVKSSERAIASKLRFHFQPFEIPLLYLITEHQR